MYQLSPILLWRMERECVTTSMWKGVPADVLEFTINVLYT